MESKIYYIKFLLCHRPENKILRWVVQTPINENKESLVPWFLKENKKCSISFHVTQVRNLNVMHILIELTVTAKKKKKKKTIRKTKNLN